MLMANLFPTERKKPTRQQKITKKKTFIIQNKYFGIADNNGIFCAS